MGLAQLGGIFVGSFARPVLGVLVVGLDGAVELARNAADGLLVADVRAAEAARGEAAQPRAKWLRQEFMPN